MTFKKIFFISLIFTLFIPKVDAATFEDGDVSYSIEHFDLVCNESPAQTGGIIGITSDNYFVPGIPGDLYLRKVNEHECVEMTTREVLDFYNNDFPLGTGYFTGNGAVSGQVVVKANSFYRNTAYIDVSGEPAVQGKLYYTFETGSDIMIDTSSGTTFTAGEPIPSGYHEQIWYKFLDSSVLDTKTVNTQDRYVLKNTWVAEVKSSTEVENDIQLDEKNILKYGVIVDESDFYQTIKTLNYDTSKFSDFYNNGLYQQSPMYNQYTEELLFPFSDISVRTHFYNANAEFIGSYSNLFAISDNLFVAMQNDTYLANEILNKNYESLFTDNTIEGIAHYKYNNYIGYGELLDINRNRYAYKLYEYKLLSNSNVTYDGNSISYDLTAPYNRIKAIYVNNKELESSNYTLSETTSNGNSNLTINKLYLDTLADGIYNLKIEYVDNATNNVTFKIENNTSANPSNSEPVPSTLDNIQGSFIIAIISIIGLTSSVIYIKKNKRV